MFLVESGFGGSVVVCEPWQNQLFTTLVGKQSTYEGPLQCEYEYEAVQDISRKPLGHSDYCSE